MGLLPTVLLLSDYKIWIMIVAILAAD